MKPWHPLPSAIHAFVEKTPGTVLLESARPGGASGISRVFTAPAQVVIVRELAELCRLFEIIEEAVAGGFFVAGYFAYECGQYFEATANIRLSGGDTPLAWFGVYERCYGFDHTTGRFVGGAIPGVEIAGSSGPPNTNRPGEVCFGLNEEQFSGRIAQIHDWIRDGDVYQLNFTFPLRVHIEEGAGEVYGRLSRAQPVDYAAFLHCERGRLLLSLSPELFFRIDRQGADRRITAQPMKGTARRGRSTAEDTAAAAWLQNDPKNRAENVMIVDLIRNDLGRLCAYGRVRVEELFKVERYRTLWQMTSTISGEMRPNVGYEEVFRALFPCGSVTGTPKVRAMQLLAQIEGGPRGAYTGAIGYFSREQTAFNVAIRTLSLKDGQGTMGVGSGIVIDSDAKAEYQECRLKAEFLSRAEEDFALIETMLWDGVYRLLELHLDRLADSAAYFDRPCNRAAIREALLLHASGYQKDCAHKVRLLLDAGGDFGIESEILASPKVSDVEPIRACIAAQRTDSNDRFFFHKTTRRALYDSVFAKASAAGFADAIFLNTRDEVTEGAISNVFVEQAGILYTPPLDGGVLPGVYRRHMLESRSDVEERILTIEDLRSADKVYLSNSVRGLRCVVIDFDSIV